MCALSHFDVYIYGTEVTVRTDHKPNLALVDGQFRSELNPRLRHFALRLQERTYRIEMYPVLIYRMLMGSRGCGILGKKTI